MFILNLLSNPVMVIIFLLLLVIAVTVHEFAHAYVTDRLGDPTPQLAGRLTLNPKAHLDPVGSFMFLIAGFGWGKPVPFDPYNLKNPRKDAAIISFAGPASNLIMALTSSLFLFTLQYFDLSTFYTISYPILSIFIYLNVILAFFNLLPFGPLDGFKIVGGLLNEKQAMQWYSLERYGLIFLIFFILPFFGSKSMLELFLLPLVRLITSVLM